MGVLRLLLTSTALLAIAGPALATEDIISVTTATTTGSPSTAEGYTFDNVQQSVTSVTTATNTYQVISAADNVFVRRNNVNNDQSSVWYTTSGVGTDLSGIHQADYGQMLLSNNVLVGSDNTFANGTDPTTGNIERIDFTWNSPITVSNSFALALFERGAVGVHDAFAIATVTAIDGAGNPTAFGPLLIVVPGWGGSTNAVNDFTYRLFRYSNGNDISTSLDSSATAIQGLGGVLITAADLGLTTGSTVYGYSLMGSDVTATNSAQLLDWTNSTYFPTNTDATTGGN
ncbi:MAG TPA: hypothetical protein VFP99_08825, partial [Chthoniobacterales bacterium]|nr:hypothetical protein [Chthoniobacterales bacterium]